MYSRLYKTHSEGLFLAMEQVVADNGKPEYQYLVDRYSQSITKYEAKALFDKLTELAGSVVAAAKAAEITRKTVYDWDKVSDDLKANTKRKILHASLEADYYWTLGFLARKANSEYKEVLQRFLDCKIDRISNSEELEDFQSQKVDFIKFMRSNIGAIQDLKNTRIDSLLLVINKKAQSLNTEGITESIDYMNQRELSQRFLQLLKGICLKTMPVEEMIRRINLPSQLIEQACKDCMYIYSPEENGLSNSLISAEKVQSDPLMEMQPSLPQTFGLEQFGYPMRAKKSKW